MASEVSSTAFSRVALNSSSDSPTGKEDSKKKNNETDKDKEKDKEGEGQRQAEGQEGQREDKRRWEKEGQEPKVEGWWQGEKKRKKDDDSADEVFVGLDDDDDEEDKDGADEEAAPTGSGTSKKPAAKNPRPKKTVKDSGKTKEKSKTKGKGGKKKDDGAENDSVFDHAMKTMSLKDVANMAESGPKEDWVCSLVQLLHDIHCCF